jgi:hypothetical protein
MSGLSATEMRKRRFDSKSAPDSVAVYRTVSGKDGPRQRRGEKYQQDIQHFGQIGQTIIAKHSGQSPLARQRANGRFGS